MRSGIEPTDPLEATTLHLDRMVVGRIALRVGDPATELARVADACHAKGTR